MRTRATTLIRPLTDLECARAARLLARRDPRLARIIRRVGPCRLPETRTHAPFVAMVRALVSQQLSGKAAATIFGRVVALVGGPDHVEPGTLLAVDRLALRGAGLSGAKVSYLVDLAEHVASGRLDLHDLEVRDDEFVIEAITAVKGFGRWSAEMFLMFRLNRPDVFPVGDLGIVKGMQRLLGMKSKPGVRTMLRTAEPWRPYRSVAAWYLWRSLELPAEIVAPRGPSRSPR
jgi:DNA-3-methyladenine glycosylase II